MGLSEYEHIFRENKINGKKLANLDRKKLSQYGITDIKNQEGLEDLIEGKISPLIFCGFHQIPVQKAMFMQYL